MVDICEPLFSESNEMGRSIALALSLATLDAGRALGTSWMPSGMPFEVAKLETSFAQLAGRVGKAEFARFVELRQMARAMGEGSVPGLEKI
jgi:hypothetical protein